MKMADLFGSKISKAGILERVGDISQICDARQVTFSDGRSSGVKAVEVTTGSGLAFTVLPSRGLDISKTAYNGMPISWRSSTGETSPYFYNPKNYEWLGTFFGGLLTTCGLTYNCHPCSDEGKELGLHGRISNTPAGEVCVLKEWAGDEYVIKISGKVRETSVFGDNLVLHRAITTSLGSRKLVIKDKIVNIGFRKSPLMMLYHVNAGWPVVSEHSRLISPTRVAVPRDGDARIEAEKYASFPPPQKDFAERVYFLDNMANANGMVNLGIVNEKLNIGLFVKYPKSEFPYFIEWKQTGQGEYVVGLEPANSTGRNRAEMRRDGTLEFIEPGQERQFTLELGVITGVDEISELEEKAAKVLTP